MTDEQRASLLRAIRSNAESLNEEGYHTAMHAPTVAAQDIRFLLAELEVSQSQAETFRRCAARNGDELNRIKEAMFPYEPPSMETVAQVVQRICEERRVLRSSNKRHKN